MLVVFALILLVGGLIGVVNPRWVKMGSRKQATLALVLGVIILVFTLPADTTTTGALVEYTIENRQDMSVAGMPRYTYRVTVPEGATEGQMVAVAKVIVGEEKKRGALSTVTVFFYHPGDDLNLAFTAGRVVYAPDGDIAKARDVRPGDYGRHQYAFTPGF